MWWVASGQSKSAVSSLAPLALAKHISVTEFQGHPFRGPVRPRAPTPMPEISCPSGVEAYNGAKRAKPSAKCTKPFQPLLRRGWRGCCGSTDLSWEQGFPGESNQGCSTLHPTSPQRAEIFRAVSFSHSTSLNTMSYMGMRATNSHIIVIHAEQARKFGPFTIIGT